MEKKLAFCLLVSLFLLSSFSFANVKMYDRSMSANHFGDFPESRFGSPPYRENTQNNNTQGRSPAGLYFDEDQAAEESDSSTPFIEAAQPEMLIPEGQKGVQEVALIAGDLGFFPKTVFVTEKIPVRIFVTGASEQNLCIMMDTFQVRKQVDSKKVSEITFTPDQPGQFRFYCPINGMEGTLVVKEMAFKTQE